ncbi:hypothetical protein FE257_003050 [Aspergillus nanangensis]|uniref:C2H2-type domain-containing protein n=1 Tax=Aspergillus nanangensis TaxID=2582783 RepID=A0AAD4CDF2_ASPNN|nr:hypothetical protein FE257_003050 [Aspergillus nanangensis]
MSTRAQKRRERICPWCSQIFWKEDHLARHITRHTREKPFTCGDCVKSFTRYDSLLRHARSHAAPSSHQSRQDKPSGRSGHRNAAAQRGAAASSPGPASPDPPRVMTASLEGENGEFHGPSYGDNELSSPSVAFHSAPLMSPYMPQSEQPPSLSLARDPVAGLPPPPPPVAQPDPTLHLPSNGDCSFDWELQASTWLADDDFDLEAFNASVIASAVQFNFPPHVPPIEPILLTPQSAENAHSLYEPHEDVIRRHWFTYLDNNLTDGNSTGYDTPVEKTQVDDIYRENLAQRLQQRLPTEPLPSTDFLNMCLRMYFTRFQPIFPIIHQQTFRPSVKRSLLLLSICSMGSIFLGSAHATQQGVRIFETLNKAILSTWESYISRGKFEALSMIQAALIGQTFGMLTGRPKHLLTVQTFHGTVITWARRNKLLPTRRAIDEITMADLEHAPEKAWRTWSQAEEEIRFWAALSVLDAEFTDLFLTEPLVRHRPVDLIADDELWTAPNAQQWSKAVHRQAERSQHTLSYDRLIPPSSPTGFRAYAELEGLTAAISEATSLRNNRLHLFDDFEPKLVEFFEKHLRVFFLHTTPDRQGVVVDKYCLQALWHANFLALLADFDRLEQALGREGFEDAKRHGEYATNWANSADGRRCAAHSVLILQMLERLPVGVEPAIHVPRVLFRATIAWYCYVRFGRREEEEGEAVVAAQDSQEFTELSLTGTNCGKLLFEAQNFQRRKPRVLECSVLCRCVDLLGRVGHWGIARRLNGMWDVILHGT